jgi:C4-dicarboxylate transporter
MHSVLLFGVMLISTILCLFIWLWVDKQATEDLGVQQVETAEQELVVPLITSIYPIMFLLIIMICIG